MMMVHTNQRKTQIIDFFREELNAFYFFIIRVCRYCDPIINLLFLKQEADIFFELIPSKNTSIKSIL